MAWSCLLWVVMAPSWDDQALGYIVSCLCIKVVTPAGAGVDPLIDPGAHVTPAPAADSPLSSLGKP